MDEGLEVVAARERRVAVAVDADDLGRDALADLRLVGRLGEDHQPRVGVEVDEPGRDDLAGGVDRAARRCPAPRPPSDNEPQAIALDHDRARPPRRPGPVDDRAARDEDVGRAHRSLARVPRPLDRAGGPRRRRSAPDRRGWTVPTDHTSGERLAHRRRPAGSVADRSPDCRRGPFARLARAADQDGRVEPRVKGRVAIDPERWEPASGRPIEDERRCSTRRCSDVGEEHRTRADRLPG